MAYRYRNRHSNTSLILHIPKSVRGLFQRFSLGLLIFVAVVMILAGKSENSTVTQIRIKVLDTLSPIMDVIAMPFELVRTSSDSLKTYFFVHSKNEKLEAENRKLRISLINLYKVQKENHELKKLLHFVQDIEYEHISAKVVGNASGPFSRSALINVGVDNGILKGQAVIMNGALIGRIIEVGNNSSRILLLTDINSKISVMGMDSREKSILSGNNTENPKLVYLPKESKISDGEVIITSGDGNLLPAGLMVGQARKMADGSYQIIPFVNWYELEYVSVLGLKKQQ